jgi:uncharacterized membrane protein (UPF0127 family)
VKLIKAAGGAVIADKLVMKDSLRGRVWGLLGTKELGAGEGIILKPCTQIHTFFMRMPIDAVFISGDLKVLYAAENMRPWRVSPLLFKSVYTVEIAAGALAGRLKAGDAVSFRD